MPHHPPPMSPLRVFVNGVPVDSPSKVAAEPGAPAKGATSIPTPPPADDSFWGTGAWKIRVDGLDVAAPSPGAVQPPASGPPTAGHVRVLVGGEEVPLIVRGPREVSPGADPGLGWRISPEGWHLASQHRGGEAPVSGGGRCGCRTGALPPGRGQAPYPPIRGTPLTALSKGVWPLREPSWTP